jgi:uncharacterized membrane protein
VFHQHRTTPIAIGFAIVFAALLACSDRGGGREATPESAPQKPASFVNQVWTVADSPSGASGELYVFLSEGTLLIASPDAKPSVGRWSRSGDGLTMIEGGLPYEVEILALDSSEFRFRMHAMGKTADFRLVPADQSMPDTTRTVEFNPAEHTIIASGTDPAWLLHVDGASASLRTAVEGTLYYTDGAWEREDAPSWRYDARRVYEGGVDSLSLTIRTGRCVEDTSSAEYPLQAALVRKGKRLEGCAVAGRPQ